jgi:hypothetical protein
MTKQSFKQLRIDEEAENIINSRNSGDGQTTNQLWD